MLCRHSQCGGIWQEKGFFSSLTIFKCLLLFLPRSRRFWLPWCQRTRSSRKCPAGAKAFGNPKSYSCKKSVHLWIESSNASHSHSCHFFLWNTATSALPQSRSGKEFGYTRLVCRSTITPRQQEKTSILLIIPFSSSSSPEENGAKCHHHPAEKWSPGKCILAIEWVLGWLTAIWRLQMTKSD